VTSNPDFKVTILFDVKKLEMVQDRAIVTMIGEYKIQWPTNRKSHMVYRTAPFSMTLNDPNPVSKVTCFDAE